MTRRDLARVFVRDTSGDLMDLTAILSYERDTNYVIKDKMSDTYTCARMYVTSFRFVSWNFHALEDREFLYANTRGVKDCRTIAV